MYGVDLDEDIFTDRVKMLKLGGVIYERVGVALKSRYGILEQAAELISELAFIADTMTGVLVVTKLDIHTCSLKEVRPIAVLHTFLTHLRSMTLFRLSSLELTSVCREDIDQLVREVWILKALTRETLITLKEFI